MLGPHQALQNTNFRFYKEKQLHYLSAQGPIPAAIRDENTVEVCAPHLILNLTPGTGSDSQAEATLDKTKGVQQQERVRSHRKRLRVPLVVGEMIFKIYDCNIQPRDGTRGHKNTKGRKPCARSFSK